MLDYSLGLFDSCIRKLYLFSESVRRPPVGAAVARGSPPVHLLCIACGLHRHDGLHERSPRARVHACPLAHTVRELLQPVALAARRLAHLFLEVPVRAAGAAAPVAARGSAALVARTHLVVREHVAGAEVDVQGREEEVVVLVPHEVRIGALHDTADAVATDAAVRVEVAVVGAQGLARGEDERDRLWGG